jgi:hypothetical protein
MTELASGDVACLVYDAMAGVNVVRIWQFENAKLEQALGEWKSIVGLVDDVEEKVCPCMRSEAGSGEYLLHQEQGAKYDRL